MAEGIDSQVPVQETQIHIPLWGYKSLRIPLPWSRKPLQNGEEFHTKVKTGWGGVVESRLLYKDRKMFELDSGTGQIKRLYPSKQASRNDDRWSFLIHFLDIPR